MGVFIEYQIGAISGVAGVVFGHPLDTVKVQLQVQAVENKYTGLSECIKTVHKQGMRHGFFRGMSWPALSYGLVNSMFFGTYVNVLNQFSGTNEPGRKPELLPILVAGSIGGAAQLSIATPVEVIKVVLQSQIPHATKQGTDLKKYYNGPLEGMKDIVRTQGIRGMYRGLPSQLYRDLPASACYWAVFEYGYFYGHKHLPFLNDQVLDFVVGGMAGVISWSLIMPFDVVKSRVQANSASQHYRGFLDCAWRSYREEGLSVFFRGYSVTALRAFLVNAVTLLVYIECKKAVKRQSEKT